MADRVAKWQSDFKKARAELSRTSAEQRQWDLLSGPTRTQQGVAIRGKVAGLKVEFSRLLREVDKLSSNEQQPTRKSIAQWKDDLTVALTELNELTRRLTQAAGQSAGGCSAMTSPAATAGQAPTGDFQRMEEGSLSGRQGLTSQCVSQRAMFEQQQQMIREFDEPLAALQGTVDNIGRTAGLIAGEVRLQNQMLDTTNEATDRMQSRMGQARTLLDRFSASNRGTRCLTFWVLMLLAVLIALFIWVLDS